MSSFASSTIFIAAIFVALAPVALAWFRPALGLPVAAGYLLLFVGVIAIRSDFSGSAPALAWTKPELPAGAATDTNCREALTVAEEAAVILDRSAPSRVVVNGAVWRQLPDQVRTALADCLRRSETDDGQAELEIIER